MRPHLLLERISNNHLIPENADLASTIKKVKVGDQVKLTGTLTEYRINDADGVLMSTRGTSLVRSDTGNGACETILLSDITVLKRHMPWRTPLLAVLWVIILTWLPLEIYWGVPRFKKGEETLTGKPHVENPYDVKNFIEKKDP